MGNAHPLDETLGVAVKRKTGFDNDNFQITIYESNYRVDIDMRDIPDFIEWLISVKD